jgi:hypothetical protein
MLALSPVYNTATIGPLVYSFASFFITRKKPHYPKHLKEKFGDRRWIDVEDPALLNYEVYITC